MGFGFGIGCCCGGCPTCCGGVITETIELTVTGFTGSCTGYNGTYFLTRLDILTYVPSGCPLDDEACFELWQGNVFSGPFGDSVFCFEYRIHEGECVARVVLFNNATPPSSSVVHGVWTQLSGDVCDLPLTLTYNSCNTALAGCAPGSSILVETYP